MSLVSNAHRNPPVPSTLAVATFVALTLTATACGGASEVGPALRPLDATPGCFVEPPSPRWPLPAGASMSDEQVDAFFVSLRVGFPQLAENLNLLTAPFRADPEIEGWTHTVEGNESVAEVVSRDAGATTIVVTMKSTVRLPDAVLTIVARPQKTTYMFERGSFEVGDTFLEYRDEFSSLILGCAPELGTSVEKYDSTNVLRSRGCPSAGSALQRSTAGRSSRAPSAPPTTSISLPVQKARWPPRR